MTSEKQRKKESWWSNFKKPEVIISLVALSFTALSFYVDYLQNNRLDEIYRTEHPEPVIRSLSTKPIEIGPPLNACVNTCTFNLTIEVFVFTKHDGEFVISNSRNQLYLEISNQTKIQLGFDGDVERDSSFLHSIGPTNDVIYINFDFEMYYRFLGSTILHNLRVDIAKLCFHLEFHDLQSPFEWEKSLNATIVWNNQTSPA